MSEQYKTIRDLEILEKDLVKHRRQMASQYAAEVGKKGHILGSGGAGVASVQHDLEWLRAAIKEERQAIGIDRSNE